MCLIDCLLWVIFERCIWIACVESDYVLCTHVWAGFVNLVLIISYLMIKCNACYMWKRVVRILLFWTAIHVLEALLKISKMIWVIWACDECMECFEWWFGKVLRCMESCEWYGDVLRLCMLKHMSELMPCLFSFDIIIYRISLNHIHFFFHFLISVSVLSLFLFFKCNTTSTAVFKKFCWLISHQIKPSKNSIVPSLVICSPLAT